MELVTLRPFSEADVNRYEHDVASVEETGIFQWFGYRSFVPTRRRFLENGFLTKDEGMLTVVAGTDAVGHVGWFTATWGPPTTSSCFSIFIGLHADQRRRGYGTEAQRLLCEYLFAHTRVERIQAFTDVDNVAEQQALEKAGFEREGVLRRAQWRDGAWHDMALYAALRN